LRIVEADLVPVVRRCGATSRQVQSQAPITRSHPQPRPVDCLSVHPHCALRCLPLGACVGASESRCEPPRRVPLTGQPARATGMISSWPPTRRRSTAQSRQPGTRCARVCSPSTVEGLGHVGVELRVAAGTRGPSLTPAASPKCLSTRPTRPHDYPTNRCTRVLIFAPPARRLRFEQLQGVGQPTAPVAPALQSTRKGTGKLAARRKWRPLARFGSMTRGSSGGATQIRQARGGIKKIEVMWYMGLKKGPLHGLCLVFRVFLTARVFTGDVGWLLPPRHGPYQQSDRR